MSSGKEDLHDDEVVGIEVRVEEVESRKVWEVRTLEEVEMVRQDQVERTLGGTGRSLRCFDNVIGEWCKDRRGVLGGGVCVVTGYDNNIFAGRAILFDGSLALTETMERVSLVPELMNGGTSDTSPDAN